VRGAEHRAAMRSVVDVFGADSQQLVFVGSCVRALYARPSGHALTATKDVDCIFIGAWISGLQIIVRLVGTGGPLEPVPEVACRYRIKATSILVDVMAKDGSNVGAQAHWLSEARGSARSRGRRPLQRPRRHNHTRGRGTSLGERGGSRGLGCRRSRALGKMSRPASARQRARSGRDASWIRGHRGTVSSRERTSATV
jgi:hypothetical protein